MPRAEAMALARARCALVRVCGPDPRGLKAGRQAFHLASEGRTTLSCSGTVLAAGEAPADGAAYVVASGACLVPFLTNARSRGEEDAAGGDLSWLPGVEIAVLLEQDGGGGDEAAGGDWAVAEVVAIHGLPGARAALVSILSARPTEGVGAWSVGWSMHEPAGPGRVPAGSLQLVLLRVPGRGGAGGKGGRPWRAAGTLRPGEWLAAAGAPFGAVAPDHFRGSLTTGVVSNVSPPPAPLPGGAGRVARSAPDPTPGGAPPGVVLADMRALPGMEGGPVVDAGGQLVGLLGPPLLLPDLGAEIPLVIPADAIRPLLALGASGWTPDPAAGAAAEEEEDDEGGEGGGVCMAAGAAAAARSVVLLKSPQGHWASGIVVSPLGHVLTNAHFVAPPEGAPYVSARVDGPGAPRWMPARTVFVGYGHLDVAVLQLEPPPGDHAGFPVHLDILGGCDTGAAAEVGGGGGVDVALREVRQELRAGGAVAVVGHALHAPAAALAPSVTAGVVSKVVSAGPGALWEIPAMIQTTAAVHPGASGGAVISPRGTLLGLVTSNTRHSKGTFVPHLNYSIAVPMLRPLADFIAGGGKDPSQLHRLHMGGRELGKLWNLSPGREPPPASPGGAGRGAGAGAGAGAGKGAGSGPADLPVPPALAKLLEGVGRLRSKL